MAALTKKTTILFEPDKYERLKRIAQGRSRTVGELIRESVELRFGLVSREERLAAVAALAALDLPVGTWEELETETVEGATRCSP